MRSHLCLLLRLLVDYVPPSVGNARERLAHVRSLPSVDSERQRIAMEQQQLVNERLEIARKLAKLSEQMLKIQAAETKVVLAALQAATDMQSLDKAVSEANDGYKQAEKELEEGASSSLLRTQTLLNSCLLQPRKSWRR